MHSVGLNKPCAGDAARAMCKKHHQSKWHDINIYLENLWEETWADLLADKVIYSRQAGHGAAQRPVRGRPGSVRAVNPVHQRIRGFQVQVILVHHDGPGWHYLTRSKFYHERLHISDAHATLQFGGHSNCLTIKKKIVDQVEKSYAQSPLRVRRVTDLQVSCVASSILMSGLIFSNASHSCFR